MTVEVPVRDAGDVTIDELHQLALDAEAWMGARALLAVLVAPIPEDEPQEKPLLTSNVQTPVAVDSPVGTTNKHGIAELRRETNAEAAAIRDTASSLTPNVIRRRRRKTRPSVPRDVVDCILTSALAEAASRQREQGLGDFTEIPVQPKPTVRLNAEQKSLAAGHLTLVSIVLRKLSVDKRFAEEARQVGVMGLVDAATRFDRGRNVPFAAYAPIRIAGEIQDWMRSESYVSRGTMGRGQKAEQLEHQGLGDEQICEELHITPRELSNLRLEYSHRQPVLLDGFVNREDGEDTSYWEDLFPYTAQGDGIEAFENDHYLRETGGIVDKILGLLSRSGMPERNLKVYLAYVMKAGNQTELAGRYGVTNSRVSQIITDTNRYLRDRLLEDDELDNLRSLLPVG